MTEIWIRTAIGRIHVFDDDSQCAGSSDDDKPYDFIHQIPNHGCQSTSVNRGIRVYTLGSEMACCLVMLPGESRLGHSNALMRNRILYLGSGTTLCALNASDLSFLWSLDFPSGFGHGLYFPPLEQSVIAVGGGDATCVNSNGTIRWRLDFPETPVENVTLGTYHINFGFSSGSRIEADYLTGEHA